MCTCSTHPDCPLPHPLHERTFPQHYRTAYHPYDGCCLIRHRAFPNTHRPRNLCPITVNLSDQQQRANLSHRPAKPCPHEQGAEYGSRDNPGIHARDLTGPLPQQMVKIARPWRARRHPYLSSHRKSRCPTVAGSPRHSTNRPVPNFDAGLARSAPVDGCAMPGQEPPLAASRSRLSPVWTIGAERALKNPGRR